MTSTKKKTNIFITSEIEYMDNLIKKVKKPYLSNIQIIDNIKKYRLTKDNVFLNIIIINFIKLIINKARKYKRSGINIGDLIHYGIEGIIEAVDRYDLEANEKFITYITIIIERRIKDGLDIYRNAVTLPKNVMTSQRKLKYNYKLNSDTKSKLNITSAHELVYSKINVENPTILRELMAFEKIDTIESSIENELSQESLQFDILRILNVLLTPMEKEIIIHSFGINDESVKALDAIGTIFNISLQKVRKIKNDALVKIKNDARCVVLLNKYLE